MHYRMVGATLDRAGARATLCILAAALAFVASAVTVKAQEPSPAAVAAAKELIELKGATNMFDPVVPGVVETAKNMFLQTNLSLAKDLNDVAAQLKKDYAAKRAEISNVMARIYAAQFSEKEIKEAVAFYKTPLGKKLIEVEPRVLEQSMANIQSWADRFSEEVIGKFRAEMRKKGHNL
jgi:uncharacterized protein